MSASARIEDLKKRYEENPRRFFAPLANEYRKAGDLAHAIALCQSHLSDQPGTLNGHVVYGQSLYDAGRFDEARGTFTNALTLDPENLIALRHLGDIARALGDGGQARLWYTRVLDADPRNHEMRALLAELPLADSQPRVSTPAVPTMAVPTPPVPTPIAPAPVVRAPAVTTPPVTTPAVATVIAPSDMPTPIVAMPRVPMPASPRPLGTPVTGNSAVVTDATAGESDGLMDLALDQSAPVEGGMNTSQHGELSGVDLMFPPAPVAPTPARPQVEADEILFDDVHAFAEPGAGDAGASAGFDSAPFAPLVEVVPSPWEAPLPFVTETMAELYVQQGFRDEALAVYRQLLSQRPGDAGLMDCVRALEGSEHSSLALDHGSEELIVPGSARQEEPPPASDSEIAAGTDMSGAAALDEVPVMDVQPSPEPARSARDFFAALAVRRAVRRDTAAPALAGATRDQVIAPSAPARDAGPGAPGATLDSLFANAPIAAGDEQLAMALAAVSQGIDVPAGIKGRPTQPAATELSLDAVFRETSPRAPPVTTTEPEPVRFDQFFSTPPAPGADRAPTPAATPGVQPRSTAELAQFQDWLHQLKKP